MEKENKVNVKDLIIKIVLIIVIIILLIHNCVLLKGIREKDNKKTPTGNVDIFEIDCTNKDTCDKKTKDDDSTNKENSKDSNISNDNNKSSNNNSQKGSNDKSQSGSSTTNDNNNNDNKDDSDIDDTDEDLEFKVLDNDKVWSSTNTLRIFSNPAYNFEQKIAPESSNTYKFQVKNNTNYNVTYKINFIEKNTHHINMVYRLKRGNTYVAGSDDSWVSYNGLNLNNVTLNSKKSHTYYLEWKWKSSDNDNQVSGIEDAYNLKIEIEAESNND